MRWSYDEAHRSPYGLEGYVQNTWRFGLDRVLAGVAMSDDAERWIGTTLPLDDVGSTSIDLAGRLAELVDRLQHVTDRLTGSHPVGHWLHTLREGIESLTDVSRGDEWQSIQLHRDLGYFFFSSSLWDSLVGTSGAVPRRADDSHLAVGHPLLSSLAGTCASSSALSTRWFRDSRCSLLPQPP